jgi:hypothetical protein
MQRSFSFHRGYFLATFILFIIEVLIALFVRDRFIRPYVGDVLVVMLIYCFVRTWWRAPVWPLALAVLGFAFFIEIMQYYDLVGRLGLQDSPVAVVVLGNSFAWEDLVAYTAGIALVIIVEGVRPGS